MQIPYIDMHCDSLLHGLTTGALYESPGNMLDVSGMVAAGQGGQFFAVFFPPPEEIEPLGPYPEDDVIFERASRLLLETVKAHPEVIRLALHAKDVAQNLRDGICSAVLTIEDGRAVRGDMDRLRRFYAAGVRAMSLTWNDANCFGYPNSADPAVMGRGLTDFGRAAIAEMNAVGMLVDVSHLSDGGFWDVMALSKKPVAATHSNCRALCAHPRNLTDEMIAALANSGGVAGINFNPGFLTEDGRDESRVDDLCRHVLHLIRVGGEDCVALGTDFDGIHGQFEVGRPEEMHLLFSALLSHGLTERQLEKFAYGNVLRLLQDVL